MSVAALSQPKTIVTNIGVEILQMFQHLEHLIYGVTIVRVMNMTHQSGLWLLETTFVKIEL